MSRPVRSTIGQIFLQFVLALLFFVVVAGMAAADSTFTANNQALNETQPRHVTVFQAMDQQTQDRRLAGQLKASIAFDKELFKLGIEVDVQSNHVTLSGQVATQQQLDKIVGKALLLIEPEQLTSQLEVLSPSTQASETSLVVQVKQLLVGN